MNPAYRQDIVPGATEPCAIRMNINDINKFIDMQDSVYRYRADELLTRRAVVEVNDVPTFTHHRKKGRHARATYGKRSRRGHHSNIGTTKRGKRNATAKRGGSKKKRGAGGKRRRR